MRSHLLTQSQKVASNYMCLCSVWTRISPAVSGVVTGSYSGVWKVTCIVSAHIGVNLSQNHRIAWYLQTPVGFLGRGWPSVIELQSEASSSRCLCDTGFLHSTNKPSELPLALGSRIAGCDIWACGLARRYLQRLTWTGSWV